MSKFNGAYQKSKTLTERADIDLPDHSDVLSLTRFLISTGVAGNVEFVA